MKTIAKKLAALRKADKKRVVFGAASHDYQLAPPLKPAEVAAVEKQFGGPLPDDYRQFLLEIGAGGAGPAYGVFPLVKTKKVWRWDGDGGGLTGDLGKPWLHTKAWNLDGDPIWDTKPDEFADDDDDFDAKYDRWLPDFQKLYYDPKWTQGAICLHHEGCALRSWLVVTGPERGNMWFDGMSDEEGLSPIKDGRKKRATFSQWYERWLDRSLASLKK